MEPNISENMVECSSSTKGLKRSRESNSVAWEMFDKFTVNGLSRAKCRICSQEYGADGSCGTSNLLRHWKIHMNESETGGCRAIEQEVYREKMAIAIIKHNYPFSYVKHEGNRDVHAYLNPKVQHITRNTSKADIIGMYERQKVKLKHELESIPGRICLTTDLWTSLTTDGYLALTAHYIDEDWVLQKKILNFRHVPPPHGGPILAERIIYFLREWGIDKKVFSVTLDNAKYNDGLIDVLKRHMSLNGSLLCHGNFFHVRCCAHVLNLIVQSGLDIIDGPIKNIRESVKYVRGSEGRKIKFAECIIQVSVKCTKKVRQDVPTRWNSTYLMLESALLYRLAFDQLYLVDPNFKTCPTVEEWERVEKISRFLKPFNDITTLFSGSRYPTANLYFHGVWKIQSLILEEMNGEDVVISTMATKMKAKFDKYWKRYSMILSFAVILDPRYKIPFIEFCLKKLNSQTYEAKVEAIKEKLRLLFDEYVTLPPVSTSHASSSPAFGTCGDTVMDGLDEMVEFDEYESQQYGSSHSKSHLELYLQESRLDRKNNMDLDILSYWKANSTRFPKLSLMARDILSIPITSVASESSFSTGGRIISKYRSSIIPVNVEALLCCRDWFQYYSRDDEDDEEPTIAEDFGPVVASQLTGSDPTC